MLGQIALFSLWKGVCVVATENWILLKNLDIGNKKRLSQLGCSSIVLYCMSGGKFGQKCKNLTTILASRWTKWHCFVNFNHPVYFWELQFTPGYCIENILDCPNLRMAGKLSSCLSTIYLSRNPHRRLVRSTSLFFIDYSRTSFISFRVDKYSRLNLCTRLEEIASIAWKMLLRKLEFMLLHLRM